MRADIERFIKHCESCQKYKPTNRRPHGYLGASPVVERWETLSIDLVGPLPSSAGYRYILTVEDICTRWVEFFPLRAATANIIAIKLVNEVFYRFGLPKAIRSNNGSQFTGDVMKEVCNILGLHHQFSALFNPQENPVERQHRELKTRVAIYLGENHQEWSKYLQCVGYAIRAQKNASTGYSPALLMFGREFRSLPEILFDPNLPRTIATVPEVQKICQDIQSAMEAVGLALRHAKEEQAAQYNAGKNPAPIFEKDEWVLLDQHGTSNAPAGITKKLLPKKDGPYIILDRIGESTYTLGGPVTKKLKGKYPVRQLHKFFRVPGENNADSELSDIGTTATTIKKSGPHIMTKRGKKKPTNPTNNVLRITTDGPITRVRTKQQREQSLMHTRVEVRATWCTNAPTIENAFSLVQLFNVHTLPTLSTLLTLPPLLELRSALQKTEEDTKKVVVFKCHVEAT